MADEKVLDIARNPRYKPAEGWPAIGKHLNGESMDFHGVESAFHRWHPSDISEKVAAVHTLHDVLEQKNVQDYLREQHEQLYHGIWKGVAKELGDLTGAGVASADHGKKTLGEHRDVVVQTVGDKLIEYLEKRMKRPVKTIKGVKDANQRLALAATEINNYLGGKDNDWREIAGLLTAAETENMDLDTVYGLLRQQTDEGHKLFSGNMTSRLLRSVDASYQSLAPDERHDAFKGMHKRLDLPVRGDYEPHEVIDIAPSAAYQLNRLRLANQLSAQAAQRLQIDPKLILLPGEQDIKSYE